MLVLLLFLRRGWLAWGLRLVGWLLLTPCAAVVADRFGGAWPGSPPAGPGGSVGAWLSIGLAAHLVPWAQAVLLGAACCSAWRWAPTSWCAVYRASPGGDCGRYGARPNCRPFPGERGASAP